MKSAPFVKPGNFLLASLLLVPPVLGLRFFSPFSECRLFVRSAPPPFLPPQCRVVRTAVQYLKTRAWRQNREEAAPGVSGVGSQAAEVWGAEENRMEKLGQGQNRDRQGRPCGQVTRPGRTHTGQHVAVLGAV